MFVWAPFTLAAISRSISRICRSVSAVVSLGTKEDRKSQKKCGKKEERRPSWSNRKGSKMTKDEIFEWIPTVRVGPVHLGDTIEKYLENLPIRACPDPFDESEFLCYAYGEEEEPSYFLDEEDRIWNIVCFDALIYQGTDLIGLPIERVIELVGVAPDEYGEAEEDVDGEVRIPVEFDRLGLQLWLSDNIASSADVSFANVDDDEVQD